MKTIHVSIKTVLTNVFNYTLHKCFSNYARVQVSIDALVDIMDALVDIMDALVDIMDALVDIMDMLVDTMDA